MSKRFPYTPKNFNLFSILVTEYGIDPNKKIPTEKKRNSNNPSFSASFSNSTPFNHFEHCDQECGDCKYPCHKHYFVNYPDNPRNSDPGEGENHV